MSKLIADMSMLERGDLRVLNLLAGDGRRFSEAALEGLGLLGRREASDAATAVLAPPHHEPAALLVVGHVVLFPWGPR